jgi:TetR/AcrR family transcriptional regulator, transcriptional repressor for nem operon
MRPSTGGLPACVCRDTGLREFPRTPRAAWTGRPIDRRHTFQYVPYQPIGMPVPTAPTQAAPDARTRLLGAALQLIRGQGYNATTVDDICAAAGVTKGSFFHHFKTKDELALGAVAHWNAVTGALFAQAPYQQPSDPRARLLAYIDFRAQLLQGEPAEFTCLLGTMVQETFATHPALREACAQGIRAHAQTLVDTVAQAKARYAPRADWSPESLALYTQAALQGAFVLAKAQGGAATAAQCVRHLKRYVELLLPRRPRPARPRAAAAAPAQKGKRR